MEDKKIRYEKETGEWLEAGQLTDEEMSDIRKKCLSTVLHFPEKQGEDIRLQLPENDHILDAREVRDRDGNISRVEVKVLDTVKFGQLQFSKQLENYGGWKIDGEEVPVSDEGKKKLMEDPSSVIWIMPKLMEAQKQYREMYGGASAAKNSKSM